MLGTYDVVVIGAGIVGLATAMKIAQRNRGLRIAIVEKELDIGLHQTGHNSGVIHAGIYYSPGTHKANFCSIGSEMLRRFCTEQGVIYRLCGKLIVAVDESEIPGLDALYKRGIANGLKDLEIIDRPRIKELEPNANGIKAVYSPNTGIVDYGEVNRSILQVFQRMGGDLFVGSKVIRITRTPERIHIETKKGELVAKHLINCGGLHADSIARMMGFDFGLHIVPFRGEYFSLAGSRTNLVNGLVYPVPDPSMPFLGVHFTKRINGTVEVGPSAVLAFAREGYSKTDVDIKDIVTTLTFPGFWRMAGKNWRTGFQEQYRSLFKIIFLRSLQRLVPDIRKDDLVDCAAGVRAQAVSRSGELLQDFQILQDRNSVHVLNAPSPAATACFAIGDHIANCFADVFDFNR